MKEVAAFFGKEVLREVDEEEFYANIAALRQKMGDRCVLRAMHFFAENARVLDEAAALKANDFDAFKKLVVESGYSSYMYLQNVFSASHPQQQGVSIVLALAQRLLEKRGGAYRVHGGGFAGTVQTLCPGGLPAGIRQGDGSGHRRGKLPQPAHPSGRRHARPVIHHFVPNFT